tara:strand:- start:1363 stop:1581 length:219 start_codon:yes stop_codon:yes gene_type:complete
MENLEKDQLDSDPSVQIFCGDKVIYPECFGDKELVFVGMANQLDHSNDCVVTHNGNACPARRSGLVKLAIKD